MALGYQNPFYLKQAQQNQQSLYNGKILLEKHDPPAVYDSVETLQLAQKSRLKMKQLNKEIKPVNYAKINQLSEVFVSQKAKSREELYFLNASKTASVSHSVSKSISIHNEEFLDDTSLSVARKCLNEIKCTIVTLQRVVKQKVTLDIHNWSSTAHQEKLEDENVELEFQVLNYAKENSHLKTTYKNLFDSINNGVMKRRNITLVVTAITMLIFSYAPLFLWAEVIATATKKIMETMNIKFDELSAIAFEKCSSKPGLQSMTSRQISLGLDVTYASSIIPPQKPTESELDLLFEAMYDDYVG
nr:Gag-Pol polyprotein [Tanacetum cinerariifolium]